MAVGAIRLVVVVVGAAVVKEDAALRGGARHPLLVETGELPALIELRHRVVQSVGDAWLHRAGSERGVA